jgi:hypothetical protein
MSLSVRLPVRLAALSLLSAFLFAYHTPVTHASSSGIVISAVYGGGSGSTKADWRHDYVELFNAGSAPVSLNGWSIQYAAATQTTWNNWTYLPDIRLLPGQYFLIQEAGGTSHGAPLPSPDLINVANPQNPHHLGSVSHKIALFSTQTRFSGGANPESSPDFVDLIGYGSSNAYEGSQAAPAINTEYQAVRKKRGCQDTNDNAFDFKAVNDFTPRNSKSKLRPCGAAKQLLMNSDFNGDSNGDRVPDGWTVKNRTSDDIECNTNTKSVAFAGACAFVFSGSASEFAVLQQHVDVANLTLGSGDQLVLSAYVQANNSAAKLHISLKVKYAGVSTPTKVTREVGVTSSYTRFSIPALMLNSGAVNQITVQFKHRSSTGKVFVDGAMLMLHKNGSRDSSQELLPVPPLPVTDSRND